MHKRNAHYRPGTYSFVSYLFASLLLFLSGCSNETSETPLLDRAKDIPAPQAEQRPHQINQLGYLREDEYSWLRADNWQEVVRNPSLLQEDIRDHLEAENAYFDAVMAPTSKLQEVIYQELLGRIDQEQSSVPHPDGEYAYYSRYREGQQHPIFARRPYDTHSGELQGDEQILLDVNLLADGLPYVKVSSVRHSPNHQYLAYTIDKTGAEYYELHVIEISSGNSIRTLTDQATGAFAWANDSETMFWIWRDSESRPKRLYRQRIDERLGELAYEEQDSGFFMSIRRSQGGSYVVLESNSHTSNELRLFDANTPDDEPQLIAERAPDIEYQMVEAGGKLYFLTNADDALDSKIMVAEHDALARENWQDLVSHQAGTQIIELFGFRDWLVRLEIHNALPRIVVRELHSGNEHSIAFNEEAYELAINQGLEFATNTLRFTYQSLATPAQVWDYQMDSKDRNLRQQRVVDGYHPDNYLVERLMLPAHDGETIPVSILRRKDTKLDGSAPLMLFGYGSYGLNVPIAFNSDVFSLVDRGLIYAIAHVRGGMEKGYHWYLDGKLDNKRNSFLDFIAVGEGLIENKYSSRGRLIAHGRSAGGLLVGASINMAPELFAGAIANVPFVDVLNTMSDPNLPLTPPEWPEWGNPLESHEDYEYIRSYSPYDNLGGLSHHYPHVLAVTSISDTRVTYWEPAKWIARMRAQRHDDGLSLFKIDMAAGHAGASGRLNTLRDRAQQYAFALMVLELTETQSR